MEEHVSARGAHVWGGGGCGLRGFDENFSCFVLCCVMRCLRSPFIGDEIKCESCVDKIRKVRGKRFSPHFLCLSLVFEICV